MGPQRRGTQEVPNLRERRLGSRSCTFRGCWRGKLRGRTSRSAGGRGKARTTKRTKRKGDVGRMEATSELHDLGRKRVQSPLDGFLLNCRQGISCRRKRLWREELAPLEDRLPSRLHKDGIAVVRDVEDEEHNLEQSIRLCKLGIQLRETPVSSTRCHKRAPPTHLRNRVQPLLDPLEHALLLRILQFELLDRAVDLNLHLGDLELLLRVREELNGVATA